MDVAQAGQDIANVLDKLAEHQEAPSECSFTPIDLLLTAIGVGGAIGILLSLGVVFIGIIYN
ncbi:hypothetical protein PENSUB_7052 [Penicillium subrubescens]|uniref:Uncharacterized protein n=1 Tax=Penicillium subrubescens TaxID=1316194 RepID=A0A1Q5TQM4_9EURO|nr:hypothetical protein PENSUB_7052 [Penicillium subrubescens]